MIELWGTREEYLQCRVLSDDGLLEFVRVLFKRQHYLLQITVSYWRQSALLDTLIRKRVEKNAESLQVIYDSESPRWNPGSIERSQTVTEACMIHTNCQPGGTGE